jgi:hypothetical protein
VLKLCEKDNKQLIISILSLNVKGSSGLRGYSTGKHQLYMQLMTRLVFATLPISPNSTFIRPNSTHRIPFTSSRLLVNHYLDTYTYHPRPQLATAYA